MKMKRTVVTIALPLLLFGCSAPPTPPPVTESTPTPLPSPPPSVTVSPSAPVPVAPASVPPAASPSPTSSADPEPPSAKTKDSSSKVIQFQPGSTVSSVEGKLVSKSLDRYTFEASAGQPGNISISSPNQDVLLTLIDPQGSPIQRYQSGGSTWSGKLPTSGTYIVDVFASGQDSSYALTVSIQPKP